VDSEHLEELAALYALGALDGDDLKEFRRLMGTEEMQEHVASFTKVADMLLQSMIHLGTPRPEVKAKLLKRLKELDPDARSNEGPAVPHPSETKGFSFVYRRDQEGWLDHPVKGIKFKQLAYYPGKGYAALLMKVPPGTRYPEHHHTGPEECYVIEGDLIAHGRTLGPGDFHHADAGSDHGVLYTKNGCTLFLVVDREDYIPG
jgi:quercetin dioxygenase-like cupin family protein